MADKDNYILTMKEVIELTSLSRSSIYNKMSKNHRQYDPSFPSRICLSKNRIGFRKGKILEWLDSLEKN